MAKLEDIKAEGAHKTVEVLKDNPDVVRATFKYADRAEAYGTYLCGKLANIFFPRVMPKILNFGQDKSGKYYIDSERVALDALHLQAQAERNMSKRKISSLKTERNAHEIDFYQKRGGDSFQSMFHISNDFASTGLPFDAHPYNWTFAENQIKNVDFKSAWMDPGRRHVRVFNEDRIRVFISKLNEREQKEALLILNELIALEK